MTLKARRLSAKVRTVFAHEPALAAIGVVGLGISAVCLVGVLMRGTFVPPEGKLLEATTFTFGVAIFTLTMALLLPLAGYSERGRRRWRLAYVTFAAYGLVLEPLQAFRGIDPRFTEVGGMIDQIAGGVFGLTAVLLTAVFLVLGLRFFRSDVLVDRPTLRNAIRYGALAVWLSFGVGILMSINAGREFGAEGDLMFAHAVGVHGIQAVPLLGWVVASVAIVPRASMWLHVGGVGWLAACAATLTQALAGRPPFDVAVLPVVMLVGLVAYAVAGAAGLRSWRQLRTADTVGDPPLPCRIEARRRDTI